MTTYSARALNRSTLARQLLLERSTGGVEDAVRRVVALQAQQPASPYVALWNRVEGFDPADLDELFAGYRVVKSTMMRITLHAVHVDDYPALRAAVEPTVRGARLRDPRFRASGLSEADVFELLPELLTRAEVPCESSELKDWFAERAAVDGELALPAWRMLRQYAPLWHAPSGKAPWSYVSGGGQEFVAATEGARPDLDGEEAADDGMRALVLRYLSGFGPATVSDVAQFGLVQKGRVRAALRELGGDVVELGVAEDGAELLYDVPGGIVADEDVTAPPRLLGMWDSVLLAYADRARVIPAEYRKTVTRVNGDVLPTVLVDGYVAGVWRVAEDGAGIEIGAFRDWPDEVWAALETEARGVLALLSSREVSAYRRYDHWWVKGLPVTRTRVL
jgi:hypothetical protein